MWAGGGARVRASEIGRGQDADASGRRRSGTGFQ
jgi:hypothetical protein